MMVTGGKVTRVDNARASLIVSALVVMLAVLFGSVGCASRADTSFISLSNLDDGQNIMGHGDFEQLTDTQKGFVLSVIKTARQNEDIKQADLVASSVILAEFIAYGGESELTSDRAQYGVRVTGERLSGRNYYTGPVLAARLVDDWTGSAPSADITFGLWQLAQELVKSAPR